MLPISVPSGLWQLCAMNAYTRAAVPEPGHPASAQEHLKAPLPRHTWRRALVLTALVLESTSPALRSLSAYLPEPMPCTYS